MSNYVNALNNVKKEELYMYVSLVAEYRIKIFEQFMLVMGLHVYV